MAEWTTERRTVLRERLVALFSLEELRTLAFDLGIDHEEVGGEGKGSMARELIGYAQRRGRLDELQRRAAALRPHVAWDAAPPASPSATPLGPDERARTERTLAMARRALDHLEEQAAGFGKLNLPAHLRIELEEKRAEVDALEAKLRGL